MELKSNIQIPGIKIPEKDMAIFIEYTKHLQPINIKK